MMRADKYKRRLFMKTQKRLWWVLLALAQAVVLVLLIFQVSELIPRKWKLNASVSSTYIAEDGRMTGAPLKFYESTKGHDYGEAYANGARYVNEYSLRHRRNGFPSSI